MSNLVIAKDPFNVDSYIKIVNCDVLKELSKHFDKWPENARLYIGSVCAANDVTPKTEFDIAKISQNDAEYFAICYPHDPITIAIVAIAAIAVVAIALQPNIPSTAERSVSSTSPNNELANRGNKPRLNGRIPDIYGEVRSTPDLISLPYSVYEGSKEVEYAYMCVGRGYYDISDVRDDTTRIEEISGAKVRFFNPNTSPNSGTPFLELGGQITEPVRTAVKCSSVNGQTLEAPGVADSVLAGGIWLKHIDVGGGTFEYGFTSVYPDGIVWTSFDFESLFATGDQVSITSSYISYNANDGWQNSTNINGVYIVSEVTATYVTFVNATSVNSNWNFLSSYPYGYWTNGNVHFDTAVNNSIVGWFTNDNPRVSHCYLNFVAQSGLYNDNGSSQSALYVDFEVEIRQLNSSLIETGLSVVHTFRIDGSATQREQIGNTQKIQLQTSGTPWTNGRCKIKVKRTTAKWTGTGNNVQDVKLKDLYFVSPVSQTHFGNVTTVQSVSRATTGALSLKERKLNCLARRKIPLRISGTTYSAPTYSNNASEIITAIATDSVLGNMSLSDLELDNIYNTLDQVRAYFGYSGAGAFNYTFDSASMSAEEMIATVAQSVHCVAYRRGNKLRLSFERTNANSKLLFNHRNKIPGSETRTVSFGYSNDYDGVELEWVDPNDSDSIKTMYIPENRSAVNPKKIQTAGIRDFWQAYFHAYRAWNKLKYSNTSVEFEATNEADLLIKNDRILVSDGTKAGSIEGEVLSQSVLTLSLSQKLPADLSSGSGTLYCFLQLPTGAVQAIEVASYTEDTVTLTNAPDEDLNLDDEAAARAIYKIVWDTGTNSEFDIFLVTERTSNTDMTTKVTAINYDSRYYQSDSDFINAINHQA